MAKEGAQAGDDAVHRPKFWGTFAGAIQDEPLKLEQSGLRDYATGAAGAEHFRHGRDDMDK